MIVLSVVKCLLIVLRSTFKIKVFISIGKKEMNKLKRIHINMHHIRHNKKHGTHKPVITVKSSGSNEYGHSVEIQGPSKVIYRPDKPLSCGARVWIETRSEINIE